MSDREWLDSLKPGDQVIVSFRGDLERVGKVSRRTKTLIIATVGECEHRFNKNGWSLGNDPWSRRSLTPYSDERRDAIRLDIAQRNLQRELTKVQWKTVPIEIVKRLRELITPFIKVEEGKI